MTNFATKNEKDERFINGVLSSYSATISNETKINYQNGTTASERPLMWLINKAYGRQFKDANIELGYNCPGIDYIDKIHKVVMQVTATVSSEKFKTSIEKMPQSLKKEGYKDFHFMINSNKPIKNYSHPDYNVEVMGIAELIKKLTNLGDEDRQAVIDYIKNNFADWLPPAISELFPPRNTNFIKNQSCFTKYIEINKLNKNLGNFRENQEWLSTCCSNSLYQLQMILSQLSIVQRNFIYRIYEFGFINDLDKFDSIRRPIQFDIIQYSTHFDEAERRQFNDIIYSLKKFGICSIEKKWTDEIYEKDGDTIIVCNNFLTLNYYDQDLLCNIFRTIGNFYLCNYTPSILYKAIRNNDFVLIR